MVAAIPRAHLPGRWALAVSLVALEASEVGSEGASEADQVVFGEVEASAVAIAVTVEDAEDSDTKEVAVLEKDEVGMEAAVARMATEHRLLMPLLDLVAAVGTEVIHSVALQMAQTALVEGMEVAMTTMTDPAIAAVTDTATAREASQAATVSQ